MANWGTELRGNPTHQPKPPEETDQTRTPPARHQERPRNHPASSSLDLLRAIARSPLQSEPVESRAPTARARQPPAKKPAKKGANLSARSKAEAAATDRILHQKISLFQGPGGVGRGMREEREERQVGVGLLSSHQRSTKQAGGGRERKGGEESGR
jgi:pyruvate/2-oxoglutarate dehydrogenase complex dihydrolipoamide acyltransferase (E2) component